MREVDRVRATARDLTEEVEPVFKRVLADVETTGSLAHEARAIRERLWAMLAEIAVWTSNNPVERNRAGFGRDHLGAFSPGYIERCRMPAESRQLMERTRNLYAYVAELDRAQVYMAPLGFEERAAAE